MPKLPLALSVMLLMSVAPIALADTHDFPSDDSAVVSSTGFIDGVQVGYFWSASRGDSVTETFADALPSVSQALFELDVVTNVLNQIPLDWDVLINDTVIGDFSVPVGFTGAIDLDFSFASIPSDGGNYEVRVEATNDIPGGAGSHTLAYAGGYGHSVTLVPEPTSLMLLLAPLLLVTRRR